MSPGHTKASMDAKVDVGNDDDEFSLGDDRSLLHQSETRETSSFSLTKLKLLIFKSNFVPWMLNCILLLSIIMITLGKKTYHCKPSPDDQGGLYSPAENAVEYTPLVFKLGTGHSVSAYQGFPTDEVDRLWEDLYKDGAFLHIDEEAGNRLLNQSVRVPVIGYENDFLVGLDVFHQLHCLNQIRMAFYPRRYNTSMVNPDGTVKYIQWLHIGTRLPRVQSLS
jgi:hypothetical protein